MILAYVGPETLLPMTSIVAGVVGIFLMLGRGSLRYLTGLLQAGASTPAVSCPGPRRGTSRSDRPTEMSAPSALTSTSEEMPTRLGPRSIVLWTVWFGMISGSLELAAFLLKCHYLDPRNYNVSRHFPWMYPVAGILILGGPGLVLAFGAWLRPTARSARPSSSACSCS